MQNPPRRVSANDAERPNVARLYDYYLGGAHNFAVDREFAEQSMKVIPTAEMVQHTRAFLRRAVRVCVAAGIRQFLDLGSGIPTAGNVHEVAQQVDPTCRVVYVDNEPATAAHGRTMLRDNPNVAMAEADLRDPDAVLNSPEARALLDLSEPVAVLMVAILPYLRDEDRPAELVARYREAMAPGSYLVVSHLTADVRPELVEKLVAVAAETMTPIMARSREEIEPLLEGFDLLEPGLVLATRWRGESEAGSGAETVSYGAVGVRR
ncbi:SAM-dependent methyltransferase [Saccharothrix variisporea]|uniref:S-adenosyl methyltransferase n=1 Tax=Saccharothrix variisporea TaxID=543527 RepID=A0A495XDX5_9PSEU|nr:SAM-dependent methyltransferase [Saccharothrix variisporea]RKT72460.1 S-adenosyl methyltransferase [Saccharothrix variisporea]